jgi:anti-anti-sigma regulatory factor
MRIDLSEVSFIDSSAVGLLVAMKRRVNDYGGHFSVRCGEQALPALRMRGLLGYLNANAPG